MNSKYTVRIEQESEADRAEASEVAGFDVGVRYWWFVTFTDQPFVNFVDKVLPKRGIKSAIHIGKDFHECGCGFTSEQLARDAADANVVDLLQRLERAAVN